MCYIADKVDNPRVNVPKAVISSAAMVSVVYGLVYLAVLGYMPWFGPYGFTSKENLAYHHIMSIFFERMMGNWAAFLFTLVVVFTIFGSAFAMMVGYVSIPRAAAMDGYFLEWFKHEHPEKKGLADNSLFFFGATTAVFCLVKLALVIEGMLTMRILVQFAAQAIAVIQFDPERTFPHESAEEINQRRAMQNQLATACAYLTLPAYIFLFLTTKNYCLSGEAPLLESACVFLMAGVGAYLSWAAAERFWPMRDSLNAVRSDLISMPLVEDE